MKIILFLAAIMAVLHQDFWNWDNPNPVFGFLPAGLAYHAAYSIVAACFWALVLKIAWPKQLIDWAESDD
jgi:uncharacterized membrane protein